MSMVPDITAGTGTESDETRGWWWPVGLSQSEGAQERVLSVDGSLFRVPGHLGVGRPSIYTTASGETYRSIPLCRANVSNALYDRMVGKPDSGNAPRPSRQDSESAGEATPRPARKCRSWFAPTATMPRDYRSILRWLLDVVDYQRLNRSLLFFQFDAKILLQRGRERRGVGVQIGTEKLRVAKCEVVISRKAGSVPYWHTYGTLQSLREL